MQGSYSFTDKKSRTFQDSMRNFPGPFRSPQMLKYKEKKKREAVSGGRVLGEETASPLHTN